MNSEPLVARSLLFVPGDSPRKIEKAVCGEADLLILDLEDAVAEPNKAAARGIVADCLRTADRRQQLWVRINGLDTQHALDDLVGIVPARPDGIMLPKATRAEADQLHHYLTVLEAAAGHPPGVIKTMVVATETARAMFGLGDYDGTPRLAALTWGSEDSATALGALANRDSNGAFDPPYVLLRSLCLMGAANAGVTAIETIHGDFRDTAGLLATASAARRAGFRGMIAIHPDQVPAINTAFTPTAEELTLARRIVAIFDQQHGLGTIGLDGEMLDMPHLKRARATIALAGSFGLDN